MVGRPTAQTTDKGIIRGDGQEWPRDFVKQSIKERPSNAVVRPKVIKFADEASLKETSQEALLTQDFVLQEIQEFF